MSNTEIYAIDSEGDVLMHDSVRNAWLGAMFVWTTLHDKYFGPWCYKAEAFRVEELERRGIKAEYDQGGCRRAWSLQNSERITGIEFCVLMCTFDCIVVLREHMEYVAKCFGTFGDEHPQSSFRDIAVIISKMVEDSDVFGLAFNWTSVCSGVWEVFVDGEDEPCPYNIKRGTKHIAFTPEMRAALLRSASDKEGVK